MLSQQKKSYLLEGGLPGQSVSLQFEGVFGGENVIWHASLSIMQEYAKYNVVSDDPEQFIDIQLINDVYQVKIVLNVKQIDRAVVESTIIMIRKYKRLQFGRHQYGVRSKTE